MRRHKQITFLISVFIVLIFILGFVQTISFSNAQSNGDTLTVPTQFQMMEFAENIDTNNTISSIDIPLPSETWNITNLMLNFSDIKLGKEINTVEDTGLSIHIIDSKGELGYGVEINITEPTIIFGVYIYGYLTGTPVDPVYVQIQGYDNLTYAPDENVLRSIPINISVPDWHLQTFDEEISLSVGSYYLVINGSELTFPADKSTYNWLYNGSGSTKKLHTAVYDGVQWSEESFGQPLLYKLIQRVNRSFNPEEINMTAEINGNFFPIINGTKPETGQLMINETIDSSTNIFRIPIKNDRFPELIFNLSYYVNIYNSFLSDGNVFIQEGLENTWTLTPNIKRYYYNYSVKFYYPSNWYNLIVKRNDLDISSIVSIDPLKNLILIPNNTVIADSSWEISANSPNVGLSLNVPKTIFEPNQDLQFSIIPPIIQGNITYILFNSLGFEEYREIIEVEETLTEELVLFHTLSSNPNKGTYKAYIFWNNQTAAGVTTQEFTINIPFVLDPMIIIIIVVGIVIISITTFTSYKLVKRSRRIREKHRKRIFNKYMDVLNLDYFIISEKESGLTIFDQLYAGKDIDSSLISGFLQAIRSFGIELTDAEAQSQTIKLDYMNLKILMSEFKNFRILLLMKDDPSLDFLDSIKDLSYEIENKFGEAISKFNGSLHQFEGIKELLEEHLETSLIYPLKVIEQQVKISPVEKSMISKAQSMMKLKNTDYFFVSNLLSTKKGFQVKDAEIILKLINKKIFQPKI